MRHPLILMFIPLLSHHFYKTRVMYDKPNEVKQERKIAQQRSVIERFSEKSVSTAQKVKRIGLVK